MDWEAFGHRVPRGAAPQLGLSPVGSVHPHTPTKGCLCAPGEKARAHLGLLGGLWGLLGGVWGLPNGISSKEPACNGGDTGSIPGSGRSLEEGMVTTPIFLPGEPHGQRSLEGYSPWGLRVRHD